MSKLRLGWATAIPDWAVVLASSVNHAGFGGGYGRLLALQLDASARMRLSPGMQLILGLENAGRTRWRFVDHFHVQSPLPSRMRVGIHWLGFFWNDLDRNVPEGQDSHSQNLRSRVQLQ